jgi:hypothetical protein
VGVAAVLAAAATLVAAPAPVAPGRVGVFNDQLSSSMTPAQVRFAATHYTRHAEANALADPRAEGGEPALLRRAVPPGARPRLPRARRLDPDRRRPPLEARVAGARTGALVHAPRRQARADDAVGVVLDEPRRRFVARTYFTSGLRGEVARTGADGVASLVRKNKIVIAQCYPDTSDVRSRMFALASYLIVGGARTYLNLEVSSEPEWFPEYDLELGAPGALTRQEAR